ncbi:hypothetical protein AB0C28_51625 [Nonomuraea sp. NPDC048892]|uniref:hypothetical protein n=1 Tax=Nonomuraea sp. NPDC048892 TaxID=3154624 RepID=UPI0033CB863E
MYRHALATEFSAVWVDRLELDELAQCLGGDFRQARRCDRDELAGEVRQRPGRPRPRWPRG